MPVFSFTSSGFPFVPFTKIISADVNQCFNDVKTFLNTTKLDDSNIQDAGITPTTKLIGTGGTAGQFLGTNGTSIIYINNPLTSQFNVIFGSAAQVTAGTATKSTFASWTQADGDRVLILPTYTETANWTFTKKVFVTGLGNTSQITGTVTFATGSTRSEMANLRTTDTITFNSGVDAVSVPFVWLATGKTFVDNSAATTTNFYLALQET